MKKSYKILIGIVGALVVIGFGIWLFSDNENYDSPYDTSARKWPVTSEIKIINTSVKEDGKSNRTDK